MDEHNLRKRHNVLAPDIGYSNYLEETQLSSSLQ